MSTLLGKKAEDIPDIDLDNLDDLLQALTYEELEELNGDFDPDVRQRLLWTIGMILITIISEAQILEKSSALYKEREGSGAAG